jgi:hypothetical protein
MHADRPQMAPGYGIAKTEDGLLPWSYVEEQMAQGHNYWIGTCCPDGRPHAMPVWGVWLNGSLYFGTDRGSRKARNLAANPAVVAHVESGNEAVIVEGKAREVTDAAEVKAMDESYQAKYGMRLSEAPGDSIFFAVQPKVIFAWSEKTFPKSATRWKL